MKNLLLYIFCCLCTYQALAATDSVIVPFNRIYFHDQIHKEQKKCDLADGREDAMVRVSGNDAINFAVTDALTRRVKLLEDYIEESPKIATNQDKILYLTYIRTLLQNFRIDWRARRINPVLAPEMIDVFEQSLKASEDSLSMEPFIREATYAVGVMVSDIFTKNPGYADSKKTLFQKFCTAHPDKILANIRKYADEPFADSLVVVACDNNPKQLYDYASAADSPEGRLIHRSTNPKVIAVAKLSQTPNALFYYPFLDNILSGKMSIDSIRKLVGDGENGYDSVGYFKLLVNTEIEYYERLTRRDTPIAIFGPNGLRDMLQKKAIQHFITPINALHEQNNLNIRMRAIDSLSARDIYFMMVMGENEIYTSSYKHAFARMLQRMGARPRGDQLLRSVNFDYFQKFIKMAANFNQLDTFLKLMPSGNASVLMKAFVANLDESDNLENAVDVADSYSSIKDPLLLKEILDNVTDNEQRATEENNSRGKIIYGLLRTIFTSYHDPSIDLTAQFGIQSIYSVDNCNLQDDSGRIVEQVFFYGDEDGQKYFPPFINSFSKKDWSITPKPEWVEIRSLSGQKNVWIYANRPLDSDKNLDDSAQAHLNAYFEKNDIMPTVVVHRGHSYWLPGTINRMSTNAKIILLGSCGGYKNLSHILEICPDAHIISTKEIGKGDINRPIINYLNESLQSGRNIDWKNMWASLTKLFYAEPDKAIRESWDDYIPPYKNLGAIFIKAFNKQSEQE